MVAPGSRMPAAPTGTLGPNIAFIAAGFAMAIAGAAGARARDGRPHLLERQVLAGWIGPLAAEEDGALDHVAQLADVAGPARRRAAAASASRRDRRDAAAPAARAACADEARARAAAISARRSRSGGIVERDAVEAEEEVLAEAAARRPPASRSRLVAATKRTSIARGFERADAEHLPLLEHAQELGLRSAERHLADLVEEHRAAVGGLEQAGAWPRSAPVKAPRSWPKSSLSSSVSGSAAQLRRTNGPLARAATACGASRRAPPCRRRSRRG